ncbi:MAG: CCA tRNA nucleotidyltransferase [Christensenellaceae bacterium]
MKIEQHLKNLMKRFAQKGFRAYVVGGAIRNSLLGLKSDDLDVTGEATPDQVALLADEELRIEPRAYGLGTFVIQQWYENVWHVYEYTTFRCDNYGRGGTHTPKEVRFTKSMKEDALRRDFTINALYADGQGVLYDPLDRGLQDLRDRLIVQVNEDTLAQDALRILRMVRFCCELDFEISPSTYACAKEYVHQLANISKERIRDEFLKILMADTKYNTKNAVLRGLQILQDLGAFAYIVPQLLAGENFAQSTVYHKYPVLEHNIRTCACSEADIEIRLAALLHDVAKPAVYMRDSNMYRHDIDGADTSMQVLQELHIEKETAKNVSTLIRYHMFDLNNDAKKSSVIRMIAKLGASNFLKLCSLREADFCGSGMGNIAYSAWKWREILQELQNTGAPLHIEQLAVNGNDLKKELNIPQGKRIGELLKKIQLYAIKKPTQNDYKSLIRYAKILNRQTTEN